MRELIIYGASDDLIEIDGDLREEFNCWLGLPDNHAYLAVSDGSLFRVRYDEDGIWRFTPILIGSAIVDIKMGVDDRRHSDTVMMTGDDLTWVALAAEVKKI